MFSHSIFISFSTKKHQYNKFFSIHHSFILSLYSTLHLVYCLGSIHNNIVLKRKIRNTQACVKAVS
ncbi:hypothetical protein MtrunA17_Chr2g0332231 [Medicago truncatula]|uniref:Transmembrane protein n=1 Tax=Medicago truncatula TaxID=3880 RepID=A0A396JJF2_MEDTR|nr:hypothetical protein MtrunA17_Chr2g0332231 [Medicago truncatula]